MTHIKTVLLASCLAFISTAAHADSECTPRPATVAESKAYRDARAAFLAAAPAAPQGWTAADDPKEPDLGEQCKEYSPKSFHFTRRYQIEQKERDARGEVELKAVQGTMAKQEQTQKSNQARIDAIDKEVEEITKENIAAVQAKKYDQIEKGNQKINELIEQKKKLMGYGEMENSNQETSAVANHDIEATFTLETGVNNPEVGDYKPIASPVGKAYQRQYDDKGNQERDIKIVIGTTTVYISGDPTRVESLFHSAKLQPVQALR
jgi:hypothetical protein